MIDFIPLFCTVFPVLIVVILFLLTWKSLHDANKSDVTSMRSALKPKRSRQHRSARITKTTQWKSNPSHIFNAPLHVTHENGGANSHRIATVIERKLQRPCLVCRAQDAKRNCRYERCGMCCRMDKESVCRAHCTGYESAIAQIELALNHQMLCVDISYAQIQQCPPNLVKLGNIPQTLNLSNNRLVQVPSKIGNLSNLVELFLQYNCLQSLPDSLCNMSSLEELDAKDNKLTTLPRQIGRLDNLIILTLTNNQLEHVPSSIGDLVNLEELSLHSNFLSQLPSELCKLKNLQVLYVGENKLKYLPDDIGQLSSLSEFDASNCDLIELPESLVNCMALTKLWLSRNRLTRLPGRIGNLRELKELHLRSNQLRYYPFSITKLDAYTVNALYNPLLDDSDTKVIKNLTRVTGEPIPPLVELSARAVVKHNLQWTPGDLPRRLEVMLKNRDFCSHCGGAVFNHYSCKITFGCVGMFRVPLYSIACSLQCQS